MCLLKAIPLVLLAGYLFLTLGPERRVKRPKLAIYPTNAYLKYKEALGKEKDKTKPSTLKKFWKMVEATAHLPVVEEEQSEQDWQQLKSTLEKITEKHGISYPYSEPKPHLARDVVVLLMGSLLALVIIVLAKRYSPRVQSDVGPPVEAVAESNESKE